MNIALHEVCILIGSNIDPVENTLLAAKILQESFPIKAVSNTWETFAIGSPGPNFLDSALIFGTAVDAIQLKQEVLRPIENRLGRVRTDNKNAPRTIDLDIIIFDNQVLDPNLWTRLFIAGPVSELYPGLSNPNNDETLFQTATTLLKNGWAKHHPVLKLGLKV